MSRSPIDSVVLSARGVGGKFRAQDFSLSTWTSFSLKHSIVAPSEASFEVGDDTGFNRVANELCQLGAEFAVSVDDRPRLVGRIEAVTSPSDAKQSTVQSFVIRTRLSDAIYSSAPQGLQLKRASIKQFILACYEAIGLTEKDFIFEADVSRDLMTGKSSKGKLPSKPLEPLTEEQAKVTPPETVFAAVDRHLRRHGYLQWDSPDGRIVIGAPDDQQLPLGSLRMLRAPYGQYNNVLSIERTLDVSQAATVLGVFGQGGGKHFTNTKIAELFRNQDLIDRGFRRQVVIVDEALRTPKLVRARGQREIALRNRGLDRITCKVDGLSYREGSELWPWAPDTTLDVILEQLGGGLGSYYVEEVEMSRNATDGDTTSLSLVKQGVWVL